MMLKNSSIYTWSKSASPSSPWTVVKTGTEAEGKRDYTVQIADEGLYIKLQVTPIDSNGFNGAAVEAISPGPVQGLGKTLKGILQQNPHTCKIPGNISSVCTQLL